MVANHLAKLNYQVRYIVIIVFKSSVGQGVDLSEPLIQRI